MRRGKSLAEAMDLDMVAELAGAACAEVDPELWFPEKGGSNREAKRICATCEVRLVCLEYALAHDERFGVWGGLTDMERREFTRKQRLRVEAELAE